MTQAPSFFCGIGGSGMSALAAILQAQGAPVSGSDRGRDQGQTPEKFAALEALGIKLFPQDGSGVTAKTGQMVVSSAIEDSIPDVQAARRLGIKIRKRADILAELFNVGRGIGIGGTSGKTTVTGMAGAIFAGCGFDPVIVNGGIMLDFDANYRAGACGWFIAETDESDGSIALYDPEIAVLNNITLDHKPLSELRPLFADFIGRARRGAVINMDDAEAARLYNPRFLGFGIGHPTAELVAGGTGPQFTVTDRRTGASAVCALQVPGRHNVSNALAAIGAALLAGLGLDDAARALAGFRGIRRRLEMVGQAAGVTVIDDFAHNPDKIAATLATLAQSPGRLLVMFQPHGFGPMRMMRRELAEAFAVGLRADDVLFMPEILYLGGTAVRDISSRDLIGDVAGKGRQARFVHTRGEARDEMVAMARPGDRIVVMGARDDSLGDFARDVVRRLG